MCWKFIRFGKVINPVHHGAFSFSYSKTYKLNEKLVLSVLQCSSMLYKIPNVTLFILNIKLNDIVTIRCVYMYIFSMLYARVFNYSPKYSFKDHHHPQEVAWQQPHQSQLDIWQHHSCQWLLQEVSKQEPQQIGRYCYQKASLQAK